MSSTSTMKALAVKTWGQAPELVTLPQTASPNQVKIRMLASALPQLVRSQAAGSHYTTSNAPLPYIPGIDGTGLTDSNELVFINTLTANPPGGSFAEYVHLDPSSITPIKLSGVDRTESAIKIASLFNPAMSSWMALKYRAHISTLNKWNVLILGATSTSGRIATRIARHLGASNVIGAARDGAALEEMKKSGALDAVIVLDKQDVSKTDFSVLATDAGFPHVVLDYVWGSTALAVMNALPRSARSAEALEVRYVHIGSLGREPDVTVSGPLLRSKNIAISGSGPGSWSIKAIMKEIGDIATTIVEVLPNQGWREHYGVVERPLEQAAEAWEDIHARTVFVMGS